jgi:hypothetical protein
MQLLKPTKKLPKIEKKNKVSIYESVISLAKNLTDDSWLPVEFPSANAIRSAFCTLKYHGMEVKRRNLILYVREKRN